jgi:HMG (high mobility group) box
LNRWERSKKGPRDPALPKRASGAYVFFTNEMRPLVLQDHPGIKFVDLGKVLGERWRALTVEDKKRFEEMASNDKIRFQEAMQSYTTHQATVASMPPQQQQIPPEHAYYHDHTAAQLSYEAYAQHEISSHHDPYGQHHQHYQH